jgi:hypothetical protein
VRSSFRIQDGNGGFDETYQGNYSHHRPHIDINYQSLKWEKRGLELTTADSVGIDRKDGVERGSSGASASVRES